MNTQTPAEKFRKKAEIRSRFVMTVGSILLLYVIVSTGQALWQNYQLNKEMVKLREKNAELKLTNAYLQNLIAYRKTDSFKDKEARSKLNFQKPGEVVLIIPDDNVERFSEGNAVMKNKQEKPRELTNPEKWWKYIFGHRGGQA